MKVAVILVLATMALLAQASDGPCPGVVSKLFNQYNPWIDSLRIACNNYRLWQYYLQYDDLCSGFFSVQDLQNPSSSQWSLLCTRRLRLLWWWELLCQESWGLQAWKRTLCHGKNITSPRTSKSSQPTASSFWRNTRKTILNNSSFGEINKMDLTFQSLF